MKLIELKATEEINETRLDLFISHKENSFSRSYVKGLINQGKVKLNDLVEYRPHAKVKMGDLVTVNDDATPKLNSIIPENIPLDIIYEDNDLLAINKPAGMVVHPASGNWQGTLMNGVLYHYKSLGKIGESFRSGLIHRLDKDTSGIILIGKTNKGLWHYSKQFAERKVQKTYIAIMLQNSKYKSVKSKTVTSFIGRNPINRKKFAEVKEDKGKKAETKFVFIKSWQHKKLLKEVVLAYAFPHTGRTHQIRVHAKSIGMPILGDKVYGASEKYERLMLHANKLQITSINGKLLELEAPVPKSFYKYE